MLTTEQTREVGRRVCYYLQNRNEIPDGGQFLTVGGGMFPTFVDDVINEVVAGQGFGPDNVQVALLGAVAPDLNEGYDGPINFAEGDYGELVLTLSVRDGISVADCSLSVNRVTGAVTFNGETRNLPDGYTLNLTGRSIGAPEVNDAQTVIMLTIPTSYDDYDYSADDDDDYDDYNDDDDYGDEIW